MTQKPIKKQLAIVGLAAGLAAGGAAGFAFTSASPFAGAQNETTTTAPTTVPAPSAPAGTPAPKGERPDPSARLQAALKGLVDDKTITQAQADKVVEALVKAGPMGGGHGGPGGKDGGPGGKDGGPGGMGGDKGGGMGGRHGGPGLDAAAKALGMTADELRTAVQSGKTLADVAKDQGVDVTTVVDAMVAEAKQHLADEVASGEHTQAEADQRLTDIEARITARVNGEMPAGGPMGGPDGGPGGR